MQRGTVGLPLIILLLAGFGFLFPSAHSQLTGLVCLAPAGATACPAPPVTVSAALHTQLQVSILISGSDFVNGFDVTLKTNHTILKPADAFADSTSLLAGGSVIVRCIGGILKAGSVCSQTDTIDTIHFALIGPAGFSVVPPVSGLLFTAVFNVTQATNTGITYQTGCPSSSVNGTSTCVFMSNGTIGIPLEMTQTASFTTAPSPTFSVQLDQSSIVLNKGSSSNSTLTIMSLNGYAGTLGFSTSISPNVNHPPALTFQPSTVTLSQGGTMFIIVTVATKNNTTRDTYSITLTVSDGSLSAAIRLLVQVIP